MARRANDAHLMEGPTSDHLVTLDRANVLFLRHLGKGSLTAGVRAAARLLAAAHMQTGKHGRAYLDYHAVAKPDEVADYYARFPEQLDTPLLYADRPTARRGNPATAGSPSPARTVPADHTVAPPPLLVPLDELRASDPTTAHLYKKPRE